VKHTTRTLSGPPSTGAAIADGRRRGRHSLLLHRPLIGGGGGSTDVSTRSTKFRSESPVFAVFGQQTAVSGQHESFLCYLTRWSRRPPLKRNGRRRSLEQPKAWAYEAAQVGSERSSLLDFILKMTAVTVCLYCLHASTLSTRSLGSRSIHGNTRHPAQPKAKGLASNRLVT
jgi:hypothetical protein